jgi:hypothetical protein
MTVWCFMAHLWTVVCMPSSASGQGSVELTRGKSRDDSACCWRPLTAHLPPDSHLPVPAMKRLSWQRAYTEESRSKIMFVVRNEGVFPCKLLFGSVCTCAYRMAFEIDLLLLPSIRRICALNRCWGVTWYCVVYCRMCVCVRACLLVFDGCLLLCQCYVDNTCRHKSIRPSSGRLTVCASTVLETEGCTWRCTLYM